LGIALLASATANAQPVPIITVSDQGDASPTTTPTTTEADLSSLARNVGRNAVVGPALSAQIAERYAGRDEWTDTLQPVRARIPRSKTRYNEAIASNQRAVADALLLSLEEDADALLAQPMGLDRERANREALMGALLFLADVLITEQPARATESLRKLATAFPEITLGPRAASTAVRTLFREQVAQLANASLVVQSMPEGCQVRRNGVMLGSAPAQLQGLVAGQHRVAIRCGGRSSLVHRVTVGASATSTVQIDIGIDRAVVFGDAPGLRYDSERIANDRMISDAAVIASAIGAERVVLYRARNRRAIVVDVLSRAALREFNDSEFNQIAAALRGSSSTTAPPRAETPPPRVAVRARHHRPAIVPRVVETTRPATSGLTVLLGVVFCGAGVVFAGGATGAWVGADYVRAQSLRIGQDGLALGGVSNSVASAETPLRVASVAGWIAGAGLAATGIAMMALGGGRREPARVSVTVTHESVSIRGAF
jgi:hypothetical protein